MTGVTHVPGHVESAAQRSASRCRYAAPPARKRAEERARTGRRLGWRRRRASPQVTSLLPRTPSSRGLRPRTAALRSSQRGAGFAWLPRPDSRPRTPASSKCHLGARTEVLPRCPVAHHLFPLVLHNGNFWPEAIGRSPWQSSLALRLCAKRSRSCTSERPTPRGGRALAIHFSSSRTPFAQ